MRRLLVLAAAVILTACGGEAPASHPVALVYTTPTPSPTPTGVEYLVAEQPAPETSPIPTPPPVVAPRSSSVEAQVVVEDGPLTAFQAEMSAAEARNGLPQGIIAAVAFRESSMGVLNAAPYNAWGIKLNDGSWASFASWPEGIDYMADRLAYWVARRGDLRDALCTWESGKTCAEYDNGYADSVLVAIVQRE